MNLMAIGKATITISAIVFLLILHRYLGGKGNCSVFLILKAILETSFQINPFLGNCAFR